ncbi:MAG TPA: nucleotidyl transferase AbiEii/AbiGii toxin family protein [Vicinamibacteria bacterium]|nr:nucleotidyl transferase AbiEii/AbiGii toxin family protein [Vicinamibacteria bacterium]
MAALGSLGLGGIAHMITKQEILDFAGDWSLGPNVVEKDYFIGWLLAKIYEHPDLASSFIFKGGTCLKKCYFETYRFSEDLDFSVTNVELLDEGRLVEMFQGVVSSLYEETGIEARPQDLRFEILENPRGGRSCEGRIYYLGPLRMERGGRARVKLDLAADELVTNDPVAMPISHPYSDAPAPPRSAGGGTRVRLPCEHS